MSLLCRLFLSGGAGRSSKVARAFGLRGGVPEWLHPTVRLSSYPATRLEHPRPPRWVSPVVVFVVANDAELRDMLSGKARSSEKPFPGHSHSDVRRLSQKTHCTTSSASSWKGDNTANKCHERRTILIYHRCKVLDPPAM